MKDQLVEDFCLAKAEELWSDGNEELSWGLILLTVIDAKDLPEDLLRD